MSTPIIEVRDLRKTFKLGEQTVHAVDNVTFTINRGEMVGIVGPSGGGKSTLLGLIGGLDKADEGSIVLDGTEISTLNERDLTTIRNEKLGFVFQFFNLIPNLNALENVALPVEFAHRPQFKPQARATELLTHFGMGDRLRHRPNQLSGGQQQRVAIARALANNPPILLADEPTGNLNTEASELVMSTLRQVRDDFGTTVILVTHDPHIASQADRMLTLVDGKLVRDEE
ncbi:MAG: ABC transporter ATP-binding protein [Anaerolineae bacterium]|nr:ABC transporter ATP-binding protein [Anaerolineae bacterium]